MLKKPEKDEYCKYGGVFKYWWWHNATCPGLENAGFCGNFGTPLP
jgi:hypothetical protein